MKDAVAVIEFGTSKVMVLVGQYNGFGRGEIIGTGNVPYDGYLAGRWNDEAGLDEVIRAAIAQAEAQSNQYIRQLYVGVPGEFIRLEKREAKLNLRAPRRITEHDVARVLEMASSGIYIPGGEIIHRSPAWFMLDDDKKTMDPVGQKASQLRCMVSFIGADAVFMRDMQARFTALGLSIPNFVSASLGTALILVPPEERDHAAVLVDVGYLSSEIMVVEGDSLVYHDVLPIGGGHMTADLVYALNVSMATAEQVKRKFLFGVGISGQDVEVSDAGQTAIYPRTEVSPVLERRVGELAEMVNESLQNGEIAVTPRTTFYLTGGGLALMRGGREFFSMALDKPVKAPLPRTSKLNNPAYTSALGLMDLVNEHLQRKPAAPRRGWAKIWSFIREYFGF